MRRVLQFVLLASLIQCVPAYAQSSVRAHTGLMCVQVDPTSKVVVENCYRPGEQPPDGAAVLEEIQAWGTSWEPGNFPSYAQDTYEKMVNEKTGEVTATVVITATGNGQTAMASYAVNLNQTASSVASGATIAISNSMALHTLGISSRPGVTGPSILLNMIPPGVVITVTATLPVTAVLTTTSDGMQPLINFGVVPAGAASIVVYVFNPGEYGAWSGTPGGAACHQPMTAGLVYPRVEGKPCGWVALEDSLTTNVPQLTDLAGGDVSDWLDSQSGAGAFTAPHLRHASRSKLAASERRTDAGYRQSSSPCRYGSANLPGLFTGRFVLRNGNPVYVCDGTGQGTQISSDPEFQGKSNEQIAAILLQADPSTRLGQDKIWEEVFAGNVGTDSQALVLMLYPCLSWSQRQQNQHGEISDPPLQIYSLSPTPVPFDCPTTA